MEKITPPFTVKLRATTRTELSAGDAVDAYEAMDSIGMPPTITDANDREVTIIGLKRLAGRKLGPFPR